MGPLILDENLKATKVTPDDLRAKLREANVTDYRQIKAVVLETTGDISVLHTKDSSQILDDVTKKIVGMDCRLAA